jgi:hypothetical protein
VGTPASSTNNTDRHDIVEILLKVALNTVTLTHIKEGVMGGRVVKVLNIRPQA